jgi:hypothetical protein
MTMVAALTAAVTAISTACPVGEAVYQLRGEPGVTARFEPRTPSSDWVAQVSLSIHSVKTGATYFLLPYSGNGQGVTTHLASVVDPDQPPDPDSAKGRPIGDLDYLAADQSYRFDQSFHAETGMRAPAHLLIPGLQEALWYRADKREGVPMAFFDLVRCRGAKGR